MLMATGWMVGLLVLGTPVAAETDADAPSRRPVTVLVRDSALPAAVGAVAVPVGALWGAVVGAGAGVVVARAALGNDASVAGFGLLYVGMGAVLGGLCGVIPGLLLAVGVDAGAWLFWARERGGLVGSNVLSGAVVLLGALAVGLVAAAGAGLVLLTRTPSGGPRRDPVGTVALCGAAAGTLVLLGAPVLAAAVVGRGWLWRELMGREPLL